MRALVLVALAALAVGAGSACSNSPKAAAETPLPPPAPKQAGIIGNVPLDSVSITIERQPCFGFCPVYTMKLTGRGEVVYNGTHHVGVTGEQRGTMSVDAFVELVDEFRRLRFEDTPAEYASRHGAERQGDRIALTDYSVTDLPTTILTLQIGAWSKSTRLYVDYPVEFRALADSIDSKSGALRWIAGAKPGVKGDLTR